MSPLVYACFKQSLCMIYDRLSAFKKNFLIKKQKSDRVLLCCVISALWQLAQIGKIRAVKFSRLISERFIMGHLPRALQTQGYSVNHCVSVSRGQRGEDKGMELHFYGNRFGTRCSSNDPSDDHLGEGHVSSTFWPWWEKVKASFLSSWWMELIGSVECGVKGHTFSSVILQVGSDDFQKCLQ